MGHLCGALASLAALAGYVAGGRLKTERVGLLRVLSVFSILPWRVSRGLEGKNIDSFGPVSISGVTTNKKATPKILASTNYEYYSIWYGTNHGLFCHIIRFLFFSVLVLFIFRFSLFRCAAVVPGFTALYMLCLSYPIRWYDTALPTRLTALQCSNLCHRMRNQHEH